MIESFVPVPILDLDAPVPQMVEQLVGVLKVFDQSLPEQVIEVPKISLQEGVPHRAALRKPQLAEQLVEVPTTPGYALAVVAVQSFGWRAARALLEQPTPPGQGGIQILATATVADVAVADVSVNMQHKFQQSLFSSDLFKNRVVVFPVATQRQVRTALSVQRTIVISRVQFLDLGVVPVLCNDKFWTLQKNSGKCRRCSSCGVVDVSVIIQRQVSGFPGRWSMSLLCRSSCRASRATDYGGNREGEQLLRFGADRGVVPQIMEEIVMVRRCRRCSDVGF